jgi:capsule polysaccharide export protein KpsE/RkpR
MGENESLDFTIFIVQFIKRWKLIFIHAFIAALLAFTYSFKIAEMQFTSNTVFLPPQNSTPSLASMTSGILGLAMGSNSFPPEQVEAIFESEKFRLDIIEEFNLFDYYKLKKSAGQKKLALKKINKDIILESSEKGSLGMTTIMSFSLNFTHTNPDTAYLITQYAYNKLNSEVIRITSSEGQKSATFISTLLASRQDSLAQLNSQFIEFQKDTQIFDLPSQLEYLVEQYGVLKSEYLTNQIKIRQLQTLHHENHPSVKKLKKVNYFINKQLEKIIGNSKEDSTFLSFSKNVEYAPKYFYFLREIEVLNKMIVYLTQMREESRITESNKTEQLTVIDPARITEYKSKPKRVLLLVGFFSIYMFVVLSWIISQIFFKEFLQKNKLFNAVIKELK